MGEAEGARSETSSGTFKAERLVAEKRAWLGGLAEPSETAAYELLNTDGVTMDRVIAAR
jgi:hypothetical protein